MNGSEKTSAQPCGCDEGANYLCQQHKSLTQLRATPMLQERERPTNPKSESRQTGNTGLGGAPLRATTIPTTAVDRKKHPVASGVLDYFPDAIVAVAYVSWCGNEQHNPNQPLHWARDKSADEADTMLRHFLERGTRDTDGLRHTAKMAWRALALLQKEIEAESCTAVI